MKVELELTDATSAVLVKNLWPLYVHEISEYNHQVPNPHGLLIDDEQVTTIADQAETQSGWWKRADSLFPYLIRANGTPAGFHLIASPPSIPPEIDADFVVHEFFLLHAFRGKGLSGQGVAEEAAVAGIERHPGRWEIVTDPQNRRAVAFWRKVVRHFTAREFTDRVIDHPWGRKVAFRFETGESTASEAGSSQSPSA